MADERIDFDDIALMRAYAQIGWGCEKKVNQMVATLADVIRESGVGQGDVKPQQTLFKELCQILVVRGVFDPALSVYPYLLLALRRLFCGVPRNVSETRHKAANVGGHQWSIFGDPAAKRQLASHFEGGWHSLKLRRPLVDLLTVEDQAAVLRDFVARALKT